MTVPTTLEEFDDHIMSAARKAVGRNRKRLSNFKDGWSPTFMVLRSWLATLHMIKQVRRKCHSSEREDNIIRQHIRAWRKACEGKWTSGDETARRAYQRCGVESILTSLGNQQGKAIDDEIVKTKQRCHGRERREVRKAINYNIRVRENSRVAGRLARVLNSLLDRPRKEQLLSVVMEDGSVVANEKEFQEVLTDHFAKWFAKSDKEWVNKLDTEEAVDRMINGQMEEAIEAWSGAGIPEETLNTIVAAIGIERHISRESEEAMSTPPTLEEFKGEIKRVASNRSPGPSGITANMLKATPSELIKVLYELILTEWKEGRTPKSWSNATLVPIPKTAHARELDKLRPIQLLEVPRKIWMRIVWRKIMKEVRKNDTLSQLQYGFTPGRETAQPVIRLAAAIEGSVAEETPLHVLSMDIRRAFDQVPKMLGLYLSMRRGGIPKKLSDQITRMDSNGTVWIRTGLWQRQRSGVSSYRPERGVPQGGVISATLFTLYMDIALRVVARTRREYGDHSVKLRSGGRYITIEEAAFADDLVIIVSTAGAAQALSTAVVDTLRAFGMEVNTKKTEYLVLNDRMEGIKVNDAVVLPSTNAVRYLGLWVDPDGGWEHQKTRCQQQVQAVTGYLRNKRTSLEGAKLALTTVLYPRVGYAAKFIPWDSSELEMMDRKVAMTLRIIARKPKSLPAAFLWGSSKEGLGLGYPKISDRIMVDAVLTTLKLVNENSDGGAAAYRLQFSKMGEGMKKWLAKMEVVLEFVKPWPVTENQTELDDTMWITHPRWDAPRRVTHVDAEGFHYVAGVTRRRATGGGFKDAGKRTIGSMSTEELIGSMTNTGRITGQPAWVARLRSALEKLGNGPLTAFVDASVGQKGGPLLHAFEPVTRAPSRKATAAIIWTAKKTGELGREAPRRSRVALTFDVHPDQRWGASSTQVETMAIGAAYLLSPPNVVEIVSDSSGAIELLRKAITGSRSMAQCTAGTILERCRQSGRKRIAIIKVEAHPERRKRNKSKWTWEELGNSEADTAAKGTANSLERDGIHLTYQMLTLGLHVREGFWAIHSDNNGPAEIAMTTRKWLTEAAKIRTWVDYTSNRDKTNSHGK